MACCKSVWAPAQSPWRAELYPGAPYRGLQAFEPEHEQIFFGRTRARNELRELLARQAARGVAFVLVMGGSGSGKSSLVKAGLVPDLAEAGMIGRVGLVRTAIMRPGAAADPLSALASALLAPEALPELGNAPLEYTAGAACRLAGRCPGAGGAADPAGPVGGRQRRRTDAGRRGALAAGGRPARGTVHRRGVEAASARALRGGAGRAGEERAGLGGGHLRSDFFNRLDQVPGLVRLSEGEARYLLLPPTAGEMGQIVRQPAREAGLRFEIDRRPASALMTPSWQRRPRTPPRCRCSNTCSTSCGVVARATCWASRPMRAGRAGRGDRRACRGGAGSSASRGAGGVAASVAVAGDGGSGRAGSATARYADIARFAPGTPARRLVDALLAQTHGCWWPMAGPSAWRTRRCCGTGIARASRSRWTAPTCSCGRGWRRSRRAGILQRNRPRKPSARPGLRLAEARDLVSRRGDEFDDEVTDYITRSADADDARRNAELRAAQELAAERTRAAEQSEKARRRILLAAVVVVFLVAVGGLYAVWAERRASDAAGHCTNE